MRKLFVLYGVLVILAYLVPFTVLSRIERFIGSFLFWNAFALLCIFILLLVMRSWNE